VRRYLSRKLITYVLAFFVGVTIDWGIPRLMPGDPIQGLIARSDVGSAAAYAAQYKDFAQSFGLNVPLFQQYLDFWKGVVTGNMGGSIYAPGATVDSLVFGAMPYTLALLVPAVLLAYVVGNRLGAAAARRKVLDNTVLPFGLMLQAIPYPWLALVVPYLLGSVWHLFPTSLGYDQGLVPTFDWTFISSLLDHWFLPFLTVFLVTLGGQMIGMRNLIIYELENDSSRYLRALGARERVVRGYAYRNASLPQLSGLALALGAVIGGNIVTEIAFQYPGLGNLIFKAISNQDFFLLQGIFIFIVLGVLIANFIIDLVFISVDPRTRLSMQGAAA
jgi:peptide/nickel transport system permease protein